MDYSTALKTANAVKRTPDNYLIIRLAYDNKVVLPYKDGIALLQVLQAAEQIKDGYGDQAGITPMDHGVFTATPLSREEYLNYKMAQLMGCTLSQVREASVAIQAEEVAA